MTKEKLGNKLLKQPFLLIVVTAFLAISLYSKVWHPTWMILLTIPIYYYIALRLLMPKNRFVKIAPVFIIISLLYVMIGYLKNIWHPTWLLYPVGVIMTWDLWFDV